MNAYEVDAIRKAAYLDAARIAVAAYLKTVTYVDKDIILALLFGKAPEKKEEE